MQRKLSKLQLVTVALVFGILGTYAVIRSLAEPAGTVLYVNNAVDSNCSDSLTEEQVSQSNPLCSISKALDLSTGGETINVSGGTYGPISLERYLPAVVTIHGVGATTPVIMASASLDNGNAITIAGGSNLTVDNMSIQNGPAAVGDHPTKKLGQVAQNIIFSNDEFTNTSDGSGTGLIIRDGSQHITVENSHIYNLTSGIVGPNYRIISGTDDGAPDVSGVNILNNTLDHFKEDAMQFADWDNVTIDGNVMHDSQHDPPPAPQYHNDLIQFAGDSNHVVITDNYLYNSEQEIFIQPAFGAINDVLVENNILYNAAAYAVQSQGATGVKFINNVIWMSHYGGLLLRSASVYGYAAATDTIVANNILFGYSGPAIAYEDHNLILNTSSGMTYGPHDLVGVDPKLADPAGGDFTLSAGSPAIGAGTILYAPAADKNGALKSGVPDMGAYAYAHSGSDQSSSGSNNGGGTTGGSTAGSSDTGGETGSQQPAGGSSGSSTVSAAGTAAPVRVTVVDSKNKKVANAEVTIDNQSSKTDANGVASFHNVPTGNQPVTVKYNNKKTSEVVNVDGSATQAPKTFKISIARDKFSPALLILPAVALLAAGLVIFLRPWSNGRLAARQAVAVDKGPPVASSDSRPPAGGQTPGVPGTVYSPPSQNTEENKKP